MSEKNFPQLFAGLTVIALALVISAWFGSQAIQNLKNADNTISVTGSARKAIKADLGVWRSSIQSQAPTRQAAYKQITADAETVKSYFTVQKQVPAAALSIGNLDTQTLYELLPNGNNSNQVLGYLMTQSFEIRLPDVEQIQKLAQESQELLNRDLVFASNSPEFLYTKLGDLRVEMLAQASQDARQRAIKILESVGNRLGPVRSVRTGVFQITRPNSTEVSDYGTYDTQTIDKDITAVLTMSFAVN